MFKVLYANTNYPDRFNLWAPWNRLANQALARSGAVDPEIVVPRPYTLPFRGFPQREVCRLPLKESGSEGPIHYPRFPYLLPKKYLYAASFELYRHFVGGYVLRRIGRKDLVHAHHVFLDGYGMVDVCRKWDVPLVVDVHGDGVFTHLVRDPRVGRKMARALRFSSKVICISRNLCGLAKRFGLDEGRLEYVPLGVDLEAYRPGDREAAKEAAGLAGKIVVLFVGQLSEGKGVRYLLQAVAGLDRGLQARLALVIVGDGPDRPTLERMAAGQGIAGLVRFAGRLPPREVREWYAAADVFALPSLSEGRPTAVNEAMASGCAVVATDVSGIPEQVTDGHNGFLVPPRDPAALAGRIAYLAEDGAEAARMGRNGRQKLLDEGLTWERYAERVAGIYREVAGGRK